MAVIHLNIPDEELNQLNNFYIEEFGYDIHTPLYNFVCDEMKFSEGYSTSKPSSPPHPSIIRNKKGYVLRVYYPSGKRSSIQCETIMECLACLNEWSKYGFKYEYRSTIVEKVLKKLPNINRKGNKFRIRRIVDGETLLFGIYDTYEDASIVRQFVEAHNWNVKYTGVGRDELLRMAGEWYENRETNE